MELTMAQTFIKLIAIVRTACLTPVRLLIICLGVPNTKIVYKSGHTEYYFMLRLRYEKSIEDGRITEIEWQTASPKSPVHINMKAIESIVQLY